MVSKKTLVNSKFPYIDTFNHEVPLVISAMLNLTVKVFEHFYITSHIDVDKRLSYTQLILRGAGLKNTERFW